jgi:hypothetical protein
VFKRRSQSIIIRSFFSSLLHIPILRSRGHLVCQRTSPSVAAAMQRVKHTRNQNACDICRSRRIKCRSSQGTEVCDGCRFLGVECTNVRPRRKRGPPNRYYLYFRLYHSWIVLVCQADRIDMLFAPPKLARQVYPSRLRGRHLELYSPSLQHQASHEPSHPTSHQISQPACH